MSDFGINVETTGGTRYSDGKVVLTWLPWRGLDVVWYKAPPEELEYTPQEMLRKADHNLRQGMNCDNGFAYPLASALYWLLQICQAHEFGADDEHVPVPVSHYPAIGMWTAGRVSCYGAKKYAEFDWNEGQSYSVLLSSTRRHLDKALVFGAFSVDSNHGDEPEGTKYSGLPHVAHAAWNLACLLDFEAQNRGEELNDVSVWAGITAAQRREIEEVAAKNGQPDWHQAREVQAGRGG